jgi:hypothetical protein
MREIGSFRSQTCAGITRRAFVQAAASVPLALGLPSARSAAVAPEAPHRAKSVIVLWLNGGPSHIDTFDPKPKAPDYVAGPFAPIATRTPGVRISEILPRLAARSHLFALVRGAQVSSSHDLRGLTGLPITTRQAIFRGDRSVPPNFGSILARYRGADRVLPFIVISPPGRSGTDSTYDSPGCGGGFLGPAYDPLVVFCSAEGRTWLPSLKLSAGLTPGRLSERRLLWGRLNAVRQRTDSAPLAAWDLQFENAHRLLTGPDKQQMFELGREPEAARDAYGHTGFGQSCVLARRLVEAGIPYVQVNWSTDSNSLLEGVDSGWDTHFQNFEYLANFNGPIFDRAFAALLDDLSRRGLLESTLVVALGDMGREPRIGDSTRGDGRGHWPQAGFVVWAGAGVQGGRVVGETDRNGAWPLTDPITSLMIGTTIVELAGLDAQARAGLKVLEGGKVIHELF